jgi:hypothetical protein
VAVEKLGVPAKHSVSRRFSVRNAALQRRRIAADKEEDRFRSANLRSVQTRATGHMAHLLPAFAERSERGPGVKVCRRIETEQIRG